MTLAEKIIKYRADNGLSQYSFARLAGLTQMTIFRIENGKPCQKTTECRILNIIEKGVSNGEKN